MQAVQLAAKRTRGLNRLLALLVCATLSSAGAQTFTVSVGALSAAGPLSPQVELALDGGRVGTTTVSLALAYRNAAQLSLGISENLSFGPLGNVVFGFTTSLRTDAAAQAELTARGVIGPVALRVALGAFTHQTQRFEPGAATATARPLLTGANGSESGFSVRLGGSGRLNRSLVLEAEPELYLVNGGTALRLESRLRWLRAFADNELRAAVRAYSAPTMGESHLGIGFGIVLGRGRAPDWTFTASAGYSHGRLLPGASAEIVERFEGGQILSLSAAAEPYRRDIAPYRAAASFETGLGPGTLKVAGSAAHVTGAGPLMSVTVGYSLPVNLR
ncbi:MAG: hypothetical protein KF813_04805 [Trueperaceae bacterium]|nr:hypothetical protein [Trueperaceae bacterium]